jgi:prevent-host-death family protein
MAFGITKDGSQHGSSVLPSIDGSIDWGEDMSGTQRRVSATEARVRFGELLDGVTTSHDVVFVERAGKEVAVVVSVEDWEAACRGRTDKWARANAMLTEFHERLRAEGAIERLTDFNVEAAIRVGRDDWDEELYGRVR